MARCRAHELPAVGAFLRARGNRDDRRERLRVAVRLIQVRLGNAHRLFAHAADLLHMRGVGFQRPAFRRGVRPAAKRLGAARQLGDAGQAADKLLRAPTQLGRVALQPRRPADVRLSPHKLAAGAALEPLGVRVVIPIAAVAAIAPAVSTGRKAQCGQQLLGRARRHRLWRRQPRRGLGKGVHRGNQAAVGRRHAAVGVQRAAAQEQRAHLVVRERLDAALQSSRSAREVAAPERVCGRLERRLKVRAQQRAAKRAGQSVWVDPQRGRLRGSPLIGDVLGRIPSCRQRRREVSAGDRLQDARRGGSGYW